MLIVLLAVIAVAGWWVWGLGSSDTILPPVIPPVVTVEEVTELIIDALPTSTQPSSDSIAEPPSKTSSEVDWGEVVPITIGTVSVRASVADSLAERIAGLSNTPSLPLDMVKLFVFDSDGPQPIWMKDMRYPIDIIWVDRAGIIVHLEPAVDPGTYPQSFASPVPARYVLEANAGFAATHRIVVGTNARLPFWQ